MILEDSKGHMFNVELCLEVERDSGELLLLAKALYEKVVSLEDELYNTLKSSVTEVHNTQDRIEELKMAKLKRTDWVM